MLQNYDFVDATTISTTTSTTSEATTTNVAGMILNEYPKNFEFK